MSLTLALGRSITHPVYGELTYIGSSEYSDERKKSVKFKKFVQRHVSMTGEGDFIVYKTDDSTAVGNVLGRYNAFILCTALKPTTDTRKLTVAEAKRVLTVFKENVPDEPTHQVTVEELEDAYKGVASGTPTVTTTPTPPPTAPATTGGENKTPIPAPDVLKTLEEHEDWVKDVEKWVKTYGGRLTKEDVIYRLEKAVQVKDIKDVIRPLTFATSQELLDKVNGEVNPAKDNKKFDDYKEFNSFEGSTKTYLASETAFKKSFEKVKLLTVDEIAGMKFLEGLRGDMTAWDFKGIMRALGGNYVIKDVMAECKKCFIEDLDLGETGDTVNYAGKGKGKGKHGDQRSKDSGSSGDGCLNCGSRDHWVQQCQKPLSQSAVKLLFKGNTALKAETNKQNQQGAGQGGAQPKGKGKKGTKGGKGKGKGKDSAVVVGEIDA